MTARPPRTDDRTFAGVRRDDGAVGVRDAVLVLPSVICSRIVADRIADRVDGAVSTPHDHGCAQIGADNDQTRRTFLSLSRNPNVAGTVVVGLGCEHVQSDELAADMGDSARVRELSIQGTGGTDACVERGVAAAEELAASRSADRASAGLADLTVGVVSSDLSESTVERADPIVGDVVDEVVAAGGRAVVAGNERLTAHPDAARDAASDAAQEGLDALLSRHRDLPSRATGVARQVRERSFADVTAAWGGGGIDEVVAYGDRTAVDSGVAVVDAPSAFEEAATALAAAGAQVVLHVTGDGIPTGHPVVPVVKVSGDADTLTALPDDIDVDARESDAGDVIDTLLDVADGTPACAERHGLTEFALTRVGPSM